VDHAVRHVVASRFRRSSVHLTSVERSGAHAINVLGLEMLRGLAALMDVVNLVRDVANLARGVNSAVGTARAVGLRSGIFMLAVAVIGLAALFCPILVALLIYATLRLIADAFGLDQEVFEWLGIAVFMVGVFVGAVAATNVMFHITRRRSTLASVTGVDEDTEVANDAGETPTIEQDAAARDIDPAWLRKIDARLAVRKTRRPRRDDRSDPRPRSN
jgi:hypothetical protein